MRPVNKSVLLGLIHLALVLSVAAKYGIDRYRLPRAWARAAPYDPNLPIRGRYVRLQLEAEPVNGPTGTEARGTYLAILRAQNGRLVAEPSRHDGVLVDAMSSGDPASPVRVTDPVAFFIPEHVPDPSRRREGEELWAEVSVPSQGPPRPIRLGVKKEGRIVPLDLD